MQLRGRKPHKPTASPTSPKSPNLPAKEWNAFQQKYEIPLLAQHPAICIAIHAVIVAIAVQNEWLILLLAAATGIPPACVVLFGLDGTSQWHSLRQTIQYFRFFSQFYVPMRVWWRTEYSATHPVWLSEFVYRTAGAVCIFFWLFGALVVVIASKPSLRRLRHFYVQLHDFCSRFFGETWLIAKFGELYVSVVEGSIVHFLQSFFDALCAPCTIINVHISPRLWKDARLYSAWMLLLYSVLKTIRFLFFLRASPFWLGVI